MTDSLIVIAALLFVGTVAMGLVLYFNWRRSLRQQVLGSRERPELTELSERGIDAVLSGSFPASDPPSWNSGIARPEPLWP